MMPDMRQIRLGLEILERNLGEDGYKYIQAEHDEIYAGSKPDPDSDDGRALEALGWLWDEGLECWSAFT